LIAQYSIDELSIVWSERMWTGQQILAVLWPSPTTAAQFLITGKPPNDSSLHRPSSIRDDICYLLDLRSEIVSSFDHQKKEKN
jgi:hypothetical protein